MESAETDTKKGGDIYTRNRRPNNWRTKYDVDISGMSDRNPVVELIQSVQLNNSPTYIENSVQDTSMSSFHLDCLNLAESSGEVSSNDRSPLLATDEVFGVIDLTSADHSPSKDVGSTDEGQQPQQQQISLADVLRNASRCLNEDDSGHTSSSDSSFQDAQEDLLLNSIEAINSKKNSPIPEASHLESNDDMSISWFEELEKPNNMSTTSKDEPIAGNEGRTQTMDVIDPQPSSVANDQSTLPVDAASMDLEDQAQEQHYYVALDGPDGTGNYALITLNPDLIKAGKVEAMNCWVTSAVGLDKMDIVNSNNSTFSTNSQELMKDKQQSDGQGLTPDDTSHFRTPPPRCIPMDVHVPMACVTTHCRPPTPYPHVINATTAFKLQQEHQCLTSDCNCNSFSALNVLGMNHLQMTSTPVSQIPSSQQQQNTRKRCCPTILKNSIHTTSSFSNVTLNSSGEEVNSSPDCPKVPNNTPNTDISLSSTIITNASTVMGEVVPLPQSAVAIPLLALPEYHDTFQNIHFVNEFTHSKETHNQKERRRRHRIKNACTTLRGLVPGVTEKTDKASMLESVVKYVHHLKQYVGNQFDEDFVGKN